MSSKKDNTKKEKKKNKPNYNDNTTINTRGYSWDLVIYEIEKDYLQERLNYLISAGVVTHYSYIFHDKDIEKVENVDVAKPLHCHLLIVFNQKVSVKLIKERLLIFTEHNTFGQPLKDKRGAFRYLTHKDNLEKYQYNDKDIVNYDNYFSQYDIKTDLCNDFEYLEINQMINDYTNLSYRQQACKYGKDYIKNFKSYSYFFDLVIEQEKQNAK